METKNLIKPLNWVDVTNENFYVIRRYVKAEIETPLNVKERYGNIYIDIVKGKYHQYVAIIYMFGLFNEITNGKTLEECISNTN